MVDVSGVEMGLKIKLLFKNSAGVHTMDPVPFAISETLSPIQILVSFDIDNEFGKMVKLTCKVSDPQLSLMITVNKVLDEIVAIGFAIDGLFNTLAGDQL